MCVRVRCDARFEPRSLFAFNLQIESQAVLVRYVEIASAPPPLAAPASARVRAWGGAGLRTDSARDRDQGSEPESHTTLRTLFACLHTHSTDSTRPGLSPEKARCRYICTHYTSMCYNVDYTMNLKSLLRERRASRLSTGIYCAPAAHVWVSTGRPAPAARIGY